MSIFPAIPTFPLLFWGLALLVDRVAHPMGSMIVGLFHLVFAVFLAGYIIRDWWRLRSIDRVA